MWAIIVSAMDKNSAQSANVQTVRNLRYFFLDTTTRQKMFIINNQRIII